ncbi:MAG: hypothetical protein U1F57_06690 [bacterium]
MIFGRKEKKANPNKAAQLEAKGDDLAERKQLKKAMQAYRDSCEANPENPAIYDKLIEIKETLSSDDWSEQDFTEAMEWTLKKQELENPSLKDVYETLSPEYSQIRQLIAEMLMAPPEMRGSFIGKIKSFQGKAVTPLLDTLLSIDAVARGEGKNEAPSSPTLVPPPEGKDR